MRSSCLHKFHSEMTLFHSEMLYEYFSRSQSHLLHWWRYRSRNQLKCVSIKLFILLKSVCNWLNPSMKSNDIQTFQNYFVHLMEWPYWLFRPCQPAHSIFKSSSMILILISMGHPKSLKESNGTLSDKLLLLNWLLLSFVLHMQSVTHNFSCTLVNRTTIMKTRDFN